LLIASVSHEKYKKIWDSGGEQNIYVSHNSSLAALYTSIF